MFQYSRAVVCDTHQYMMVARLRERLAVNEQISRRFYMERFNRKELNHVGSREKYRVDVSERFATLEDWTLRWILTVLGERCKRK
jgi:DUF1365 family protein